MKITQPCLNHALGLCAYTLSMKGHLAFLDKWYEGTKALARHRHAVPLLGFISFIESVIFPVPTALMAAPMMQADHSKIWRYATICAVFSILGGIGGYLLGWFAYDTFALPLLEKLGKVETAEKFQDLTNEYGAIAVFGAGLTPFPYKVITILSGAMKINIGVFIIASIFARFGQFFLIGAIIKKFGNEAEAFMKEKFGLFTIIAFVVLAVLYILYKQLTH